MSNVEVFAMQDSWPVTGQQVGQTCTTHYIDPNDTHMNKKKIDTKDSAKQKT